MNAFKVAAHMLLVALALGGVEPFPATAHQHEQECHHNFLCVQRSQCVISARYPAAKPVGSTRPSSVPSNRLDRLDYAAPQAPRQCSASLQILHTLLTV